MQLIPSNSVRSWTSSGASKIPSGISTVCPHCGERGVFSLTNHYDDLHRLAVSSSAKCPGCRELVRFWTLRSDKIPQGDDKNPEAVYMYPPAENHYPAPAFQSDIPQALQNAFISTIDAYNSRNYVATAVCARRTLEGIFKFLVPEEKRGGPLHRLIEYVKAEADLAAPLTSLSHAIRDGGNLGAHFDMEKEPDQLLAKYMVELLDYLISYLYVLPKEIKTLEENLGKSA